MKKIIITLIISLFVSHQLFAQDCNLMLKDGEKLKLDIITYTNPLSTDNKFIKAKDEAKDPQIAAYNADVASGKIAPASNYTMEFTIKKTKLANADEYAIGYNVSGVDYYSYLVCRSDTLFSFRNRGPIEVPDGKGGIFGYSLQGPQILPMNLKVGDDLPVFDDVSFTFPTSTDMMVKKSVFDGYDKSWSDGFGYAPDANGNMVLGPTDVLTTKAVYKTIDVKVKQTLSFSSHTLHFSSVTGEEEVTINGVKYKAYIIEAESWTKSNTNIDYESADAEVNAQQKAFAEKVQGYMAKQSAKRQFTNKQGYMVMASKCWFVPAFGSNVKTESYDIWGGISSIMQTPGFGK